MIKLGQTSAVMQSLRVFLLFQPDVGTGQAAYSHNVNVSTNCFQSCHCCVVSTSAQGLQPACVRLESFLGYRSLGLHIYCTNVSVVFAGMSSWMSNAGMSLCFIHSLLGAPLCALWITEGESLGSDLICGNIQSTWSGLIGPKFCKM